jgi:hypothetical protein
VLRLFLGVAGIVYGLSFFVARHRWTAFFVRYRGGQPERLVRAMPPILGIAAFAWSFIVLTTGLFGALNW